MTLLDPNHLPLQLRIAGIHSAAQGLLSFALAPLAKGLLFIAGGIGITPIMSMIRSFGELAPAPWKLVYLTRSAAVTAFRDELSTPALRTRVKIHHDHGDAAKAFDL